MACRQRFVLWLSLWLGGVALLLPAVGVIPVVDAKQATTTTTKPSTKCDLKCRNGGACQRSSTRNLVDQVADPMDATTSEEEEDSTGGTPQPQAQKPQQQPYCQCPVGYTGLLCEIKYVVCENSNSTCRNGNPCQREVLQGQEFYHCECDRAQSDLSLSPYAVKLCEHASTVFCKLVQQQDKGGKSDTKPSAKKRNKNDLHSFGNTAGSSFCYNNGRCKEEDTAEKGQRHHHPGCNCVDGYSGQHCEISSKGHHNIKAVATARAKANAKTSATTTTGNPVRHRVLSVMVFLGIMLLFVVGGVAFLVHHGNRQRTPRTASSTTTTTKFQRKSKKKKQSALERARIPKQQPGGISEIEVI